MSVHPCCPSFTSKRMAMGSNCAMRCAKVSGLIPNLRATSAQAKELLMEASSMNGSR